MLLYKQCIHICSWSEYYPEAEEPKNENELFKNDITIYQNAPLTALISDTTTNVYIHDCLFVECSSTTNGGVIRFSKEAGKLLIELSFFDDCHSESYSGAVYATKCDCVINKICSYKCTTSKNNGQFIYTSLADNKLNYVIDSSVCSTHDITGFYSPICLVFGNQKCNYVNVSNYKVTRYSAIYYNTEKTTSEINYCSIISNIAESHYCICLDSSGYSYLISSSNIVNNSQALANSGTITCRKNTKVTQCCINENKAKYLFYIESDVTVTLEETYISHEEELNNQDKGTLIENSPQNSFMNTIEHIDCLQYIPKCQCSIHVCKCSTFVRIFRFLSLAAIYSRTKSK